MYGRSWVWTLGSAHLRNGTPHSISCNQRAAGTSRSSIPESKFRLIEFKTSFSNLVSLGGRYFAFHSCHDEWQITTPTKLHPPSYTIFDSLPHKKEYRNQDVSTSSSGTPPHVSRNSTRADDDDDDNDVDADVETDRNPCFTLFSPREYLRSLVSLCHSKSRGSVCCV